jgi:hypothetical protein
MPQQQHTRSVVAGRDFGQITVVVSLHLQVEHFRFGIAGFGDQVLVEQTLQNKLD